MPIDPALVAAGAQGLSQASNMWMTGNTNKKQRKWMEGMYERQRADGLSDWQMQADYNSPAQQMARLKAAGLNPNLVYGHGADAQMGTPVRSSSTGSYTPTAPQVDLAAPFMAMYDLKMKQATMDNMQVAKQVQEQDVLLKAAQIQNALTDNATKGFDLKMKNELKDINIDMASQALTKSRAEAESAWTNATLSEETLKANIGKVKADAEKALNESDASKHLKTRVLQEIDNLKKDGDLKQFQINLNKLGINSSDNVFLRIMTQLFGKYVPSF